LAERGVRWLEGRDGRADWGIVWTLLSRHLTGLDQTGLDRIRTMGLKWLTDPKNELSKQRGYFIEGLLDLDCKAALPAATGWLDTRSRNPFWPVVAGKAIAAAPTSPEAERWAQRLIAMIEVDPFRKGDYEKIEAVIGPAIERHDASPILQRLWSALSARPRDLDARLKCLATYMTSEEALTAHIVERRGWSAVVVVQGIRARLDHPIGTAIRDPIEVIVTQVDSKSRQVAVRLATVPKGLPQTAQVGSVEDGRIVGTNRYGLFVEFRDVVGTVDRSHLPVGTDPVRDFQLGDSIQVRVNAIDTRAIHLSPTAV